MLLPYLTILLCLTLAPRSFAASDAVVLMYHHVAEDTPAITSVTPDTFRQHLSYLSENGFQVWPLKKILRHIVTDEALPERTIAITFDDGYASVYETAYPELEKHGWPFTVFVTTRYIGTDDSSFMNWEQLKEIEANGADIGNHSNSHPHLIRRRNKESIQQWQDRVISEIGTAQQILEQQLINPLPVFAYPYGEFSTALKGILQRHGFYGMGQHSGAIGPYSNPYALPRYSITTGYDDMESFIIKTNSKALPVLRTIPEQGVLDAAQVQAGLKLKFAEGDYDKAQLACYATAQGEISANWSDLEQLELEVTANQPLTPGRSKFNCTAPSLTEKGVFYWYSFLWMLPERDGSWYRE